MLDELIEYLRNEGFFNEKQDERMKNIFRLAGDIYIAGMDHEAKIALEIITKNKEN
jgi:hypothetical protein